MKLHAECITIHITNAGESEGWVNREDHEELKKEHEKVKEELIRRVLMDSPGTEHSSFIVRP